MVFAAMLPWQLFATSLTEGSASLISNANLISKVYFPRLIIPASAVIVSFVDFAISMVLLVLLMMFYHVSPSWPLLALPVFTALALLASTGAGVWLAALNVKYRDFRYFVPFIVQFGLYISPVGFSSTIVPEKWRTLYDFNPMVGVIDGSAGRFRMVGAISRSKVSRSRSSRLRFSSSAASGIFAERNGL